MANNQYVNKVQYGNSTLIDLTGDTVTAATLLQGYTAHDASGAAIVGTLDKASGSVYQDADGYLVVDDDESTAPQGNISITQNGVYDVADYAGATVNVSGGDEVLYVYSDLDGEGVVSTTGYGYVSCDFAPVHDGKFRFWIDVDSNDLTFKAPVTVPTYSSYRYTGRIDWGDGSAQTDYEYGNTDHTHTYSEPGRYCVSIWRTGGAEMFSVSNPSSADVPKVIAYELYFIGYPTNAMGGMANVRKIRYSSAQTTVSFANYTNLVDVVIPDTTDTIGTCYNCKALKKLLIPASVTTINNGAFSGNTAMEEYHFLPTTPPTIGSTTFNNIPSSCIIYVPSASLSDYQTAQYWSDHASKMVGE